MGQTRKVQSESPNTFTIPIEMENQQNKVLNKSQHKCDEDCIHSIAQLSDWKKLQSYLKRNSRAIDYNQTDKHGKTALHYLNYTKCNCTACLAESGKCLDVLLNEQSVNINIQDENGNTPLLVAILNKNSEGAQRLISKGADATICNHEGYDAFILMTQHCPEIMVALMNNAITIESSYPNSKDCVVRIELRAVVGDSDLRNKTSSDDYMKELSFLTSVLGTKKESRQAIFTHPLVNLFLYLKWKCVRKYFGILFFYYMFWLIAYTSYVIDVYLVSCPCEYFTKPKMREITPPKALTGESNLNGANERCHLTTGITFDGLLVILLTILMAANEVVKVIVVPKLYIKNRLNFGTWILITLTAITAGPIIMERNSKLEAWQYQLAALSIFLSWAYILAQLGSFPALGRYLEMLGHVLRNFGLSMLTFSSLFIAFALSFSVLFPGSEPFSHFFYSMLRVFVMMAGEVDYKEMFYDDQNAATTGPIIGHILYAVFVILICIVLMNLLIGLTVNDIQSLQKEAELTRVLRQIGEIRSLESTFFSKRFNGSIGKILRKSISVTSQNKTNDRCGAKSGSEPLLNNLVLHIRPNDRSDKLIPESIKSDILRIALGNYHNKKCNINDKEDD